MFPIGDGYEIEVNEFDWKDENGICYDKNGVTVRHWRRSHAKDGATGYRLDWNGLSFVWTGDGRPDELTTKYAAGVDVFVTECENDTGNLIQVKYGLPSWLYNYTIDTHHTPHYATGYMIKQVNPRLGMVTHWLQQAGFERLHTLSSRGWPRPESDAYFSETALSDPLYAVWGFKPQK